MPHSRLLARLTGMVGVVALVAAGFVGLTSAASPSAHAATGTGGTHAHATNSTTGLSTDGSTDIHIVGGGWDPDQDTVVAVECGPNAQGQGDCDISTASAVGPDDSGNIDGTITVHSGTVGSHACPPENCVIQVASVQRQASKAVNIPIYFGDQKPGKPGTGSELSADLNMPDQLPYDGTGAAQTPLTVTIDNSGNGALSDLQANLTLTLPDDLTCSDVTLNETGGAPTPGTPSGTSSCTYNLNKPGLNKDEKDTYVYDFAVDGTHAGMPATTGTVSGKLKVVQQDKNGTYESTLATASDSSTLAKPAAPTFKAAPKNGATVYHAYNYDLVDSAGLPPVNATDTSSETPEGYRAFGAKKLDDGSYGIANRYPDKYQTPGGDDVYAIHLNGNFYFNASTGTIQLAGVQNGVYTEQRPDAINTSPPQHWTIIANNGEGGADASTDCDEQATGEPCLNEHDVASGSFTLPVLFGDVHQSTDFAKQIYALANDGVIRGYGDGNFKRANPVTRQAFVSFEMRLLNRLQDKDADHDTGACDAKAGETSGFPDVSVNSQFCEQIRMLSRKGVIQGYSDGTFKPAKHVSRQAIAAFLFRLDSYLKGAQVGDAKCETPTGYNDITTANPFCGDIEWLTNHKIASGYGDGGFHPDADTTRQAGSAFFYRFANYRQPGMYTDPFSS